MESGPGLIGRLIASWRSLRAREHAAPMLRCRDIVELLADYLDGALDPAHSAALDAHLAGCADCTAFVKTYRTTTTATSTLRQSELPRELRERLLTFLSQHRPR